MSRKKLFTAGLFCSLLLTMIQPAVVYAAVPSLSASADAGGVTEGDYVNIDVDLGNNPSISTLGATLSYDSSVLKYDSSTWNGGFSGSDMKMASDTGNEVNLSVVCSDSYTANGTVVTVRFQAVKDTDSIPVTLALRDMADAELSAISDCRVASQVQAPQPAAEPGQVDEEDEPVDLEDLDEASGIRIVDEESGEQSQTIASNTDSSTENAADAYSNTTQNVTSTQAQTNQTSQTVAAQSANPSGPDKNYKTGAGIGMDIYVIGAAVCGILALVLSVRHHKKQEEKP